VSDLFGIGAGVQGLITRVHGRKSRKHAEHMRRTDWEHNYIADAVADAKAAGIHTALRAWFFSGWWFTYDVGLRRV